MFTAGLAPVPFLPPWDRDFDDRLRVLMQGSPRAAYFYEKPDAATFRYRVFNMAMALADRVGGPSAAWFDRDDWDRMDQVLDSCDVLVICRARYNSRIARLIERARARAKRVLFDVDDLVFDTRYVHLLVETLGLNVIDERIWEDWFAMCSRLEAVFRLCDGAVVANAYLAERAREAFGDGRPVAVVPNFLERAQQALSDRVWQAKEASGWVRDRRIHLGYFSGTASHNRDFAIIEGPLARLMDEDPRLVLRIAGFLDIGPQFERHASRIEFFPLQDPLNLQRVIGETEVNLVPSQINAFTHCKSELKWFEAAAVGTVTVASPTYAFKNAIASGRTGWLVPAQKWEQTLRQVIEGLDASRSVVIEARDEALARHGWDRQTNQIIEALFGRG